MQVGQVGHIGAEVVATGATEPVGAGVTAGLHVGRFGADPKRHDHFTEHSAGVLGVQQRLGLPPDPVAVPVELHRRDPVDGLPAPGLTDLVVALGGVEFSVIHQLPQHIDADPGVGVPLGVGYLPWIRGIAWSEGIFGVEAREER